MFFLELELPLLENRTADFNAQEDIPEGIYYLGVQDVSYHRGPDYLLFADKAGIDISMHLKTDGQETTFDPETKYLKVYFEPGDDLLVIKG